MFIVLIQLESTSAANSKYEGRLFNTQEEAAKLCEDIRDEEFRVFNASEFEVVKSIQLKPIPAKRGV